MCYVFPVLEKVLCGICLISSNNAAADELRLCVAVLAKVIFYFRGFASTYHLRYHYRLPLLPTPPPPDLVHLAHYLFTLPLPQRGAFHTLAFRCCLSSFLVFNPVSPLATLINHRPPLAPFPLLFPFILVKIINQSHAWMYEHSTVTLAVMLYCLYHARRQGFAFAPSSVRSVWGVTSSSSTSAMRRAGTSLSMATQDELKKQVS